MTLEDLKDLLLLPDITFIDLQYTDTSEERALIFKTSMVLIF